MITVYVGDVTEYLSAHARAADTTATLLTSDNVNNIPQGTYYTSIGDLASLSDFAKILRQADQIVYAPPDKWSDSFFGQSKMQTWTEDYLTAFAGLKSIVNFSVTASVPNNKSKMLGLRDVRKTNQPQLWVAGCSFTDGDGVQPNQRYGQLLSDRLNLPVSFLSQSGSSITWAADQIIRSDLRENDMLIWGLTSIPRVNYFTHNEIHHLCIGNKKLEEFLIQTEEDILYKSLTSIYQVVNFCKKIKVDLFLVNLLNHVVVDYLDDVEVLSLTRLWGRNADDCYEDFGDDDLHPGAKTHEFYAEEIFKKIKERNR